MNVASSKRTKICEFCECCETSSSFDFDAVKNEAVMRAFKNGKLSAELTASCHGVLGFFHLICLNYCACHQKSDARSYEVLHLSRKIIVANLKISKMKPLSGNHHLTSWHLWWRCLLYNACHLKCIFADPLQRPTPAIIFAIATKPSCCAPITPATHNHILTSKSGLKPSVSNTFDLWMCFAPQQRALFRHLNFQKWSECVVSLAFRLRNVLRSTTPCTFSTTQLPKVLRRLTRRFSEAIFPPSGTTKTFKKHRVLRWPLNF